MQLTHPAHFCSLAWPAAIPLALFPAPPPPALNTSHVSHSLLLPPHRHPCLLAPAPCPRPACPLACLPLPQVRIISCWALRRYSYCLPTCLPACLPPLQVRIISCWALSRYSYWLLAGWQERAGVNAQLDAAVGGILLRVLDRNKFVQEAACSALATLEEVAGQEEAGGALEPYLQPICEHLALAVSKYCRRNMRILYDALGTLAESVGSIRMSKPSLVGWGAGRGRVCW